MIVGLVPRMKDTMIGRLLRRLKGRIRSRSALIGGVLSEPELFAQVLRLEPYVRRVLADRYWLEGALERKDEVVSLLSREKADERLRAFRQEFDRFGELAGSAPRLPMRTVDVNPQLSDRASVTPIDRHYTYHPAWAARILAKTRPNKHVDISSTVNFCVIASAFVPIDFYDFRPAPVKLDGLYTGSADLTQLHFPNDSIASLSCMHVIEHVGLGRYGDPLDPDGDLKAISELVRVIAPGGDLLVVTPVGQPRVAFNAHRVYDHEAFAGYFATLELVEFTFIEEHGEGGLVVAPPADRVRAEYYACGCFWFRKPKVEKGVQTKPDGLGTPSR